MPSVHYFWDPIEDNIIQERDDDGNLIAEYATEPGLHGNLISQNRGGVVSQYHFDPQGSTLALTDDNQNVTDTYAYNAFGEVTEHTGNTVNPFQYVRRQGYYRDELTGDYSARQRPLSSREGRWLSSDPLSEFLSYLYARNNPISRIDPSGLVDKDFSPTTPINAPWCKVGCNEPIRDPDAPPKPADPNGLPYNVYGRTEVIDYTIDCGCICQTVNPDTYRLQCRMWAYFKILISPDNIKASPNPHSERGAYGHEQRHVRNCLEAADWLADEVTRFEAQVYKTFDSCSTTKSGLESFIQSHLDAVKKAESKHDWGKYLNEHGMEPKEGKDYAPQEGKMPANSNCALPGLSKKSGIEDRHCCEIMSRFGPNPVE